MTFSGDLSGISLPDVFQNLAGNRSTGTLHVKWDKGERYVRFAEGKIAGYAPGAGKELPLLDHAVERGHADDAAVQKAISGRRRRKRPARLLLDFKLCDRETLDTAFRELTAEGIYDLFTLSTAQFSFTAGDPPPDLFDLDLLAAEVRLEVGPHLLEGARRADEMQRIRTVVGSDQDLFVADAQAHERAPDENTATVAAVLDGRTDVAGIARATQLSRFTVGAALLTLVQQGLARPATGEEIAALAEFALADNQREEAIRLLGQALVRMPRESLLRRRLAETLASAGRKREAAGELAMLAFQAAEEERFSDALSHYERAIDLDPADVLLHQRRCETLRRTGDKDALRKGLMQWAQRLESLGLADRACEVLGTHADGGPLRGDQMLLLRLAELAKANGNLPAAAARYLQIVDLFGAKDSRLEGKCLRAALQAMPDDPAIQRRLSDLESGRAARRSRRRRTLLLTSIAATVIGSLLFAGICELTTSWQLTRVLRERPADGCGNATLPALRTIAASHSFLPSGAMACAIADEESMRLLRLAADLRLQCRVDEAIATLDAALESLPEGARLRAEELKAQLLYEAPLFVALAKVEHSGSNDALACQLLERATGPEFVDFARDMLSRVHCDAARTHLLLALQNNADSRAAEAVVRAWLATKDPAVARLAERVLVSAVEKDANGVRDALEILLRQHHDHPEYRPIVDRALEITSSTTATPGR